MPAFRAETTVGRALLSIAAQTVKPREVIVVDDGSPDNTVEAAEACRAALGETALKIIQQENAGAGAARNRAVREAGGEYLAFLDADDEWLPEKLERSFQVLTANALSLVAHNHLSIDAGNGSTPVDCAARYREGPDPFVTLYRKGYLSTSTLITRRKLLLEAGGFDEDLRNAQDFDLWLQILQDRNHRFEVFGEALTRYHVTDDSITTNTRRRVRCGLEIALRFAPALKGRPGGIYRNLWIRIAILHVEAYRAYRDRGRTIRALLALLTAGPATVATTWRHLRVDRTARRNYLSD